MKFKIELKVMLLSNEFIYLKKFEVHKSSLEHFVSFTEESSVVAVVAVVVVVT